MKIESEAEDTCCLQPAVKHRQYGSAPRGSPSYVYIDELHKQHCHKNFPEVLLDPIVDRILLESSRWESPAHGS